jgi:hypothetical protein
MLFFNTGTFSSSEGETGNASKFPLGGALSWGGGNWSVGGIGGGVPRSEWSCCCLLHSRENQTAKMEKKKNYANQKKRLH